MEANKNILQIPIEDILPNRFQPRLAFDDAALNELAASIKEHGIIQPLVARKLANKFEIIAGERRYRAAKIAGLLSVPVILTEMSDKKSAEVAIVENIQRKDLSAIEEARSYKALLDKGVLNQEELARKMGLSQSAISNKLRLLALTPEIQDAIINEKISERHARSLLKLKEIESQNDFLNQILTQRLTVKQLEDKIKLHLNKNDKTTDEISSNLEETTNKVEEISEITMNSNINPQPVVVDTQSNEVIEPMNHKEESIFKMPFGKKEYPNKFFNFLEQESVNMNSDINEQNEDIEMLDFTSQDKSTEKITEIKSKLSSVNNIIIEEIIENGEKIIKIKIPN